jgi:hypothetical protein
VTLRDYERYQLELIAAEYRAKGYKVDLEAAVPESNWRFDALATKHDGSAVIVELVNAQRGMERHARLELLNRAAAIYPAAFIDLRYIDLGRTAFFMQMERSPESDEGQGSALERLNSLLRTRLPSKATVSGIALVRLYLNLWSLHVATVRAFAMAVGSESAGSHTVLDQYDSLLRREYLAAPEQSEDFTELDFHQLQQIAAATLEGAPVGIAEVRELRIHIRSVRAQIRHWKRTVPRLVVRNLRGPS